MIIALTPDIERALTEAASKRWTTPELLALEVLRERFVPRPAQEREAAHGATLADFLRGSIGVLHSGEHIPGGARMSEDSHRKHS